MSPEMIKNDPYDEKSDVYSFGIVLWELYTRKIPYRDLNLNPSHLVVKVVKEALRPPLSKSMPKPYSKLIEKCWSPNPVKRPTFKQILKVLEAFNSDSVILNHRPNSSHPSKVIVRPDNNPNSPQNDEKVIQHTVDINWRVDSADVEIIGPVNSHNPRAAATPLAQNKRLEAETSAILDQTTAPNAETAVKLANSRSNLVFPTAQRKIVDIELANADFKSANEVVAAQEALVNAPEGFIYTNQGENIVIGKFRGKLVGVKQCEIDVKLTQISNEQKVSADLSGITAESSFVALMKQLAAIRHPNLTLFMGAFVQNNSGGASTAPTTPKSRSRIIEPPSTALIPSKEGKLHVGIVQEYLYRGSLSDIIADREFVLSWDTTFQLLIDAASAMNYLHHNKPFPIIHRDLSLTKLMVDINWRVKISDSLVCHSDLGVILGGTLANSSSIYTAPELLREAKKQSPVIATEKANIYAFALIMWAIIARKQPFDSEILSEELRAKIVLHDFRPHISHSGVSEPLRQLITRCWASEPSKRPSFDQILAELREIKDAGPAKIKLILGQNAHTYRKAMTVHAYRSKDPVTILKDWGRNVGKVGHFVIFSGEDDVYLCDPDIFSTSYESVGSPENHEYRKTGTVLARCMKEAFAIKTASLSVEHGMAGDYLVQNDNGDQWSVEQKTFERLYERAG
jgi:serine/threonine protein kinase